MKVTEKKSNEIWMLKGVCMLSVFFAHMPAYNINSVNSELFGYFGIIGVPIFLFLLGFFDLNSKTGINKKLSSLFIPLIIWGSLTFLFDFIVFHGTLKGNFLVQYIKWILGFGTWYYFVPVAFECILLLRYVNKYILLFVSLVSIGLSQSKLIPYNEVFTYYINPFNFIVYPILGQILHGFVERKSYKGHNLLVSLVLLLTSLILGRYGEKIMPVYFNYSCILFSISVLILLMYLLQFATNKYLVILLGGVGKNSFIIYLVHMQVAGLINGLYARIGLPTYLEFFKAFVAILVVAIMVAILKLCLYKNKSLLLALGYRL